MEKKYSNSLGQFEQVVLTAVLALREGAYGVPIVAKVSELAEKQVNMGTVHVTLARLQDKGYVSSVLADPTPQRGGKAKRFYRVEADGIRALQESMATARRLSQALDESWRIGKWKPTRAR